MGKLDPGATQVVDRFTIMSTEIFETSRQEHHVAAMQRALTIARFGPANTENPQVGCVLIDSCGRIIAEGWHMGAGTPHAEVDALAHIPESWASRTAELTAVVTLEPCNHTGRTGPCSHALADAGIGTVVYALSDPGYEAGGGAQYLQSRNVSVISGVEADAARYLLEPWLERQRLESQMRIPVTLNEHGSQISPRPQITIKWAQTLDGRAAAEDGSSQWITGPAAREDVHRRRAAADAILVGTGTLLADNPSLTARAADGSLLVSPEHQPIPVVLGDRDIPEDARVREHPALAARGLEAPIHLRPGDFETLYETVASLADYGVTSVFVEGGPAVVAALIRAGLADRFLIYTAPTLLGGSYTAIGDIGVPTLDDALHLRVERRVTLGADELVVAEAIIEPAATTPRGSDQAVWNTASTLSVSDGDH